MNRILTVMLAMVLAISAVTAQKRSAAPVKSVVQFDEKLYNALEWRGIGPYRGGRSAAVTGVPGKSNLYYFGSVGGGVWRTTDGGNSWD
ncbi:MAG: hypothetical protein ACKORJ_07805, partial [Bacteroidota bacterium]